MPLRMYLSRVKFIHFNTIDKNNYLVITNPMKAPWSKEKFTLHSLAKLFRILSIVNMFIFHLAAGTLAVSIRLDLLSNMLSFLFLDKDLSCDSVTLGFTSIPGTQSFVSFSSSLSPRLKGSLSASLTGFGSTVDNGCHLLCLDTLLGSLLEDFVSESFSFWGLVFINFWVS